MAVMCDKETKEHVPVTGVLTRRPVGEGHCARSTTQRADSTLSVLGVSACPASKLRSFQWRQHTSSLTDLIAKFDKCFGMPRGRPYQSVSLTTGSASTTTRGRARRAPRGATACAPGRRAPGRRRRAARRPSAAPRTGPTKRGRAAAAAAAAPRARRRGSGRGRRRRRRCVAGDPAEQHGGGGDPADAGEQADDCRDEGAGQQRVGRRRAVAERLQCQRCQAARRQAWQDVAVQQGRGRPRGRVLTAPGARTWVSDPGTCILTATRPIGVCRLLAGPRWSMRRRRPARRRPRPAPARGCAGASRGRSVARSA